ncbi:hypothetical protein ACHAPJ_011909 [Fusarium lateritium]
MHPAPDVTTRWRVLQTIHPLFIHAKSLPDTGDVDRGIFGTFEGDDGEQLKNEITLLRNDLNYNVMRQKQIDIEDFVNDYTDLEELDSSLQTLLHDLEDLIDSSILRERLQHTFEPESLACFPKLVALWKLLQKHEAPLSFDGMLDDISDISDTNATDIGTESSWSKKYPSTSRERVESYIQYPKSREKLEVCRRTISQFRMAMERTVWDSAESTWASEAQTQKWESDELEEIRHAHEFASTCTSLFTRMADNTTCGTPHIAKLHLSGFKEGQLKMNIGTCQETDWISAIFTESLDEPSKEIFCFDHICSPTPTRDAIANTLHVAFNLEGMWITNGDNNHEIHSPVGGEHSLEYHLTHNIRLTLKQRKLAGVLLAASLFKLSDSPWIQQHLEPECIFVPSPKNRPLEQWCPRIHCTLVPRQDARLQSDNIAALGVLVLELEADRKADWDLDDEDCFTGERSNRVRLARMLQGWKDEVSDDYRRIAEACLNFDSLVENLDHSDIVKERKGLAVIYSRILEPLFRYITSSFGDLKPLFQGMFGPGRSLTSPINISSAVTAKRVLFDDDDTTANDVDKRSAVEFLDDLQPFLGTIGSVRQNSKPWDPPHERIRIAVLDSGIDDTQPIMRSAIKAGRINSQRSKSFVGRTDSWRQDSYSHGTHVTQLLLKTAPAAEIFIGKICTDKVINAEFMPGIAKAVNWAVNECNAHIISMSFGFDEEDDLIETAIDNAIGSGKLIIAAASNNGGRAERARPARRDGVMCIHATDGKGNKGKMNPSPLPNKDNFATLGVAVPLRWKGGQAWKSGTSFAVPIAAGIAAGVLELAVHKCKLTERKLRALCQKQGMEAMFREMAAPRDDYDFVFPGGQWTIEKDAISLIEKIMTNL